MRSKAAIKSARERIRRNPLRKQKSLSRRLNISPRSMSRLIRDDLHIKAYRRSKRHLFTPALKEIRHTRTERLLQWHAEKGDENSHLKDEKIFTSRSSTSQNDNIYVQTSREAKDKVPRVQRGHHPFYVMV